MSNLISISINNLQIPAKEAGFNGIREIAEKLAKKESTIQNICNGQLTIKQLEEFAKIVRQPFGFFFLDNPIADYNPEIPDLRTRKNNVPLSKKFFQIFKDISFKQEWYKDYLINIGANELDFVGSFDVDSSTIDIAADIKRVIKLDNLHKNTEDKNDYFNSLCNKIEEARILIMRNSVVVNSNNLKLDTKEFLGFCIADRFAPVIFINTADKTSAKIFTLMHELAHIWLGKTSVSDNSFDNYIEKKCNAIAAEVLVPTTLFMQEWSKCTEKKIEDKLLQLSSHFKVSKMVITRVALTHNKINIEDYHSLYKKQIDAINNKSQTQNKKGGPNHKVMLAIKNSKIIKNTVSNLLKSGEINFKEASLLLNTKINKVINYA